MDATCQNDRLESLLAAATCTASVAMKKWTEGHVSLTMDHLAQVPLEEAMDYANVADDLLTMVVFNIEGSLNGQLLLTFDNENGRALANSLIGKKAPDEGEQWSPLEVSAIMETGNILASAYVNELTRLTGEKLTPSAPNFLQDFGASVLGQAIMAQAMFSDEINICKTKFEFDSREMDWSVYFFPSQEFMSSLRASL